MTSFINFNFVFSVLFSILLISCQQTQNKRAFEYHKYSSRLEDDYLELKNRHQEELQIPMKQKYTASDTQSFINANLLYHQAIFNLPLPASWLYLSSTPSQKRDREMYSTQMNSKHSLFILPPEEFHIWITNSVKNHLSSKQPLQSGDYQQRRARQNSFDVYKNQSIKPHKVFLRFRFFPKVSVESMDLNTTAFSNKGNCFQGKYTDNKTFSLEPFHRFFETIEPHRLFPLKANSWNLAIEEMQSICQKGLRLNYTLSCYDGNVYQHFKKSLKNNTPLTSQALELFKKEFTTEDFYLTYQIFTYEDLSELAEKKQNNPWRKMMVFLSENQVDFDMMTIMCSQGKIMWKQNGSFRNSL